jgi:hypothetical protein
LRRERGYLKTHFCTPNRPLALKGLFALERPWFGYFT